MPQSSSLAIFVDDYLPLARGEKKTKPQCNHKDSQTFLRHKVIFLCATVKRELQNAIPSAVADTGGRRSSWDCYNGL